MSNFAFPFQRGIASCYYFWSACGCLPLGSHRRHCMGKLFSSSHTSWKIKIGAWTTYMWRFLSFSIVVLFQYDTKARVCSYLLVRTCHLDSINLHQPDVLWGFQRWARPENRIQSERSGRGRRADLPPSFLSLFNCLTLCLCFCVFGRLFKVKTWCLHSKPAAGRQADAENLVNYSASLLTSLHTHKQSASYSVTLQHTGTYTHSYIFLPC